MSNSTRQQASECSGRSLKRALQDTGLLLLLLCAGAVSAAGANSATEAPNVHPQPPTARIGLAGLPHDLGRVRGGDVARGELLFTNTGTATLELKLIKSSCGCLVVGEYDQRVEAGGTGRVPIALSTENYSGEVAESVRFNSNDPNQREVVFGVKTLVWRPIEVTPRSAIFDVIPGAATGGMAVLRITNRLSEPIAFNPPTSSLPSVVAELATNEPGRVFTLTVRAVPPLGGGNLFGRVTLKTSSTEMPVLEIPVFAMIQPPLSVMPPRLALPSGTLTNALSFQVTLQGTTTNALKLSAPQANATGVQLSLKEVETGRQFSLGITFPAGFVVTPGRNLEIGVKSNDPRFPEIRIPVVVMTKASRADGPASP